jgi:hypothetical protein
MARVTNLIKIVTIEVVRDGGDCVQQCKETLSSGPSQSDVVQGNDAPRCAVEVETDTAQTLQIQAWTHRQEVL